MAGGLPNFANNSASSRRHDRFTAPEDPGSFSVLSQGGRDNIMSTHVGSAGQMTGNSDTEPSWEGLGSLPFCSRNVVEWEEHDLAASSDSVLSRPEQAPATPPSHGFIQLHPTLNPML